MQTDYPSGAGVHQPQSPHTVQPRLDVRSQPLTFSKDMSNEQLAQWLRNHPSLSGANYEEDISKLSGTCCTTNYFDSYIISILIFLFRCSNYWSYISEPE
jgi:hypothetical protein